MTLSMAPSRREFLAGSASLALLGACSAADTSPIAETGAGTMRKLNQIGIQTYTLRNALAENFVGTFEMIKDVGYDYVELNGRNFEDRTPKDLYAILDSIGLPAPASHVGYDSLAKDPARLADMMAELGCRYAILPWVDEDQRSADDYKRHADMLNRASDAMQDRGVRVAYHNHQFEFWDLGGGQNGMDILLNETDGSLVDIQLDLFWATLGEVDIPALFAAHPGRFKLCHVKDMKGAPTAYLDSKDYGAISRDLMVNVGEGDIDFASLFALNDVSGMEYFIAEHDNPRKPYRNAIETSYRTMRTLRF